MKKVLHYLLVGIAALATIYLFVNVILFVWFGGGISSPVRFELPPGYKGWFLLKSDDSACMPYRRQGMWRIVQVGNDGTACVSDPRETGWEFAQYVYLHPNGSTTKVQEARAVSSHTGESGVLVDVHFVGSAAELKLAPDLAYQPLTKLAPEDKEYLLRTMDFAEIFSVEGIPTSVISNMVELTQNLNFTIANPSEVIPEKKRPSRRLLWGVVSKEYCLLHYERDGMGPSRRLVLFKRFGNDARFLWGAATMPSIRNYAEFRELLDADSLYDSIAFYW
jgi:hypothetical protein